MLIIFAFYENSSVLSPSTKVSRFYICVHVSTLFQISLLNRTSCRVAIIVANNFLNIFAVGHSRLSLFFRILIKYNHHIIALPSSLRAEVRCVPVEISIIRSSPSRYYFCITYASLYHKLPIFSYNLLFST